MFGGGQEIANTPIDWEMLPPIVKFCNINQDGYAGTNGNIRSNPLFFDPANGNYHLQSSSPCIDSGTSVGGVPTYDIDGNYAPLRLWL